MSISKLVQVIQVFRASNFGYYRTEYTVDGEFKWRGGKIRHFPSIFRILSPLCIHNNSKQSCRTWISQEDFRRAIWSSTACYNSRKFLSSPQIFLSLQWHEYTHTHLLDNFPSENIPTTLGKAIVPCHMHGRHNVRYSPIGLE